MYIGTLNIAKTNAIELIHAHNIKFLVAALFGMPISVFMIILYHTSRLTFINQSLQVSALNMHESVNAVSSARFASIWHVQTSFFNL